MKTTKTIALTLDREELETMALQVLDQRGKMPGDLKFTFSELVADGLYLVFAGVEDEEELPQAAAPEDDKLPEPMEEVPVVAPGPEVPSVGEFVEGIR